MKQNIKRIALVALVLAVVTAVSAQLAFAHQENNLDSPCQHRYVVTGFAQNTAQLQCTYCGDTEQMSFADYVGAARGDGAYDAMMDVNADGIINGRDLAVLKHIPDGWVYNPHTGEWQAEIDL